MSFDPRSRRFDPNWPLPAIETDWSETSDAPGAALVSRDEESTDDPVGSDHRRGARAARVGGMLCVSSLRGDRGERWIRAELRTIRRELAPEEST